MAKTITEIRSLARSHTRSALNVLLGVMRSKDATAAARVSAANAVLDRGWGKATKAIENGDNGALEMIHRIERIIGRTRCIGGSSSGEAVPNRNSRMLSSYNRHCPSENRP
jgi:hypothetical protein